MALLSGMHHFPPGVPERARPVHERHERMPAGSALCSSDVGVLIDRIDTEGGLGGLYKHLAHTKEGPLHLVPSISHCAVCALNAQWRAGSSRRQKQPRECVPSPHRLPRRQRRRSRERALLQVVLALQCQTQHVIRSDQRDCPPPPLALSAQDSVPRGRRHLAGVTTQGGSVVLFLCALGRMFSRRPWPSGVSY